MTTLQNSSGIMFMFTNLSRGDFVRGRGGLILSYTQHKFQNISKITSILYFKKKSHFGITLAL